MRTDELIALISKEAGPVARLPSPARRAALWLALALPWVMAAVFFMTPRPDLAEKLADPRFGIEQAAAFATAFAAAFAAFSAVVPGRPRWPLALPLVSLGLWLASLGEACIGVLMTFGAGGLRIGWDWACIPAIAMVGAAPAAAILVMLRRGAPVMPCTTIALGALAAAALGNFGLRFFHPQDASLMVLVWQFGTVALLTALGACFGRYLLGWPHARAVS